MLNIVVPMAGRGSRFALAGYALPKPLIPVGGRPMISWVVENIRPRRPHRFIFLCLAEHLQAYPSLPGLLADLCPDCRIVAVDQVTEGAACTVLLARVFIDNEDQLMIANSDQFVECSIDRYLTSVETLAAAGLIMTFEADHPKWSYCRLGPDGLVREVVEKRVISNVATVGIYNFARGRDFVSAANAMIAADRRVNGEYYVAPVYNELIARGAKVISYSIGAGHRMHGLGTPEDLAAFLESDFFRARIDP